MADLFTPAAGVAFLTLTAMEIVLGIDNIIFISILVTKLPRAVQSRARRIGISLALIFRLGLIFSLSWLMTLTRPLFTAFGNEVSGRDLILIFGGLFLIAKSVYEIHEKLESGPAEEITNAKAAVGFAMVVAQIGLIDIIFSLDSVITAIGMSNQLPIMVGAMLVAVAVMALSARPVGDFVHRHPTIKILALAFLVLIGTMLLMDGLGTHVNKGYIYFAMAFSVVVEMLNLRFRGKLKPVELKTPSYVEPMSKRGPPSGA